MTIPKRHLERGETSGGGIGLSGGIFLVFLFLKLAELGAVADWSWWWVTSPLWIPAIIIGSILLVGATIWGIGLLFESKQARARRKARAAISNLGRRR